MRATPTRMPESAIPQYWSDLTHSAVIVIIVIAASVLGYSHHLDQATVGNVYTAAIGYAAGRAGSVAHRALAARKADDGQPDKVDITA